MRPHFGIVLHINFPFFFNLTDIGDHIAYFLDFWNEEQFFICLRNALAWKLSDHVLDERVDAECGVYDDVLAALVEETFAIFEFAVQEVKQNDGVNWWKTLFIFAGSLENEESGEQSPEINALAVMELDLINWDGEHELPKLGLIKFLIEEAASICYHSKKLHWWLLIGRHCDIINRNVDSFWDIVRFEDNFAQAVKFIEGSHQLFTNKVGIIFFEPNWMAFNALFITFVKDIDDWFFSGSLGSIESNWQPCLSIYHVKVRENNRLFSNNTKFARFGIVKVWLEFIFHCVRVCIEEGFVPVHHIADPTIVRE